MDDLKSRWSLFLSVIVDPWVLFFIAGTVLLLFASTHEDNATASILYYLLTTIVSGVLGGRLNKLWVDKSEGGALRGRGKAAVRGLKLLLSSIVSLDRKAQRLLESGGVEQTSREVMYQAMEEVRERCNILAEEAVSAIENWTDIVPEADIKTQIGLISELKIKLEERESELSLLAGHLSESQNKSQEEMKSLRKRYQEKEQEAEKVKEELRRKQVGLGSRFFTIDPALNLGLTGVTLSALSQSRSAADLFGTAGQEALHKLGLTSDKEDKEKK